LLSARGHISSIMATNLLGAIVGGLLEYNSMYLGFRALYVMAMACYVLAFVSEWIFKTKDAAGDRGTDLSDRSLGKAGRRADTDVGAVAG
jgi:hypothetical protein